MAEFLQTLPSSEAKHVARRSPGTRATFAIYGWGLPIARGAAQSIKVLNGLQATSCCQQFCQQVMSLTYLYMPGLLSLAIELCCL